MSTNLDRIAAMTEREHRSALCFLAGYRPELLAHVLDEIDEQRETFAATARKSESTTAATEYTCLMCNTNIPDHTVNQCTNR
jgi:hypothetical protein